MYRVLEAVRHGKCLQLLVPDCLRNQVLESVQWDIRGLKYGVPERLHSDQGRNYESEVTTELCKLYGPKKCHKAPHHTTGNAKCVHFIFISSFEHFLQRPSRGGLNIWQSLSMRIMLPIFDNRVFPFQSVV